MQTILVIDDDVYIGNMLETLLQRAGYGVLRAYSGTEALMVLDAGSPDLILLDLMLPGISGEELLAHIQGIPVIVLSAKVDVRDKVEVLLGGAADYLTKPFDTSELLARITVQLRKRQVAPNCISVGEISMDTEHSQTAVRGMPVHLTKTEYAILKLVLQHPTQVITKDMMLEKISADTPDCVESSLKVHISNLRRKLRAAGAGDCIESVWGVGFKLREES